MAKEGQSGSGTFEALSGAVREAARRGPPPVHLWNPPDCGDIPMRIAADGTWFYQGSPIGRPALVKLFASVLRRDGERYVLVTPVEKCGITVDDVPFLAVEMVRDAGEAGGAPVLRIRTNVDDWVTCGAEHALRFEPEAGTGGLKPYLHVRRGLWARVVRPLYYDLVEIGEEREIDGRRMFGVASGSTFFPMTPADTLAGHDPKDSPQ
ncbi:DUF1285 domain-containing protein [Rhodoplanes roseus]|uniref:Proteophosphoglycan n=1 Tax=Rhodoplanes roseus TaxID=29409 RepID=A0A327KX89_9BRAD|nr:DUF1285 domain-containing protein [Rhodoplanes roseus]RAI39978.1 hypothetical protein CH341_24725 [Rhodoplanes roseus]